MPTPLEIWLFSVDRQGGINIFICRVENVFPLYVMYEVVLMENDPF